MTETNCIPAGGAKPIHKVPWRDRLRVFWQCWKCRKTGKAIEHLKLAFKNDPGFRQTWHANIAMPIYDATRPQCYCYFPTCADGTKAHDHTCQMIQAETIPRRFECREMSIEQANYIADRLMKHLFDV